MTWPPLKRDGLQPQGLLVLLLVSSVKPLLHWQNFSAGPLWRQQADRWLACPLSQLGNLEPGGPGSLEQSSSDNAGPVCAAANRFLEAGR